MKETEISYLAGVIDSEGYIGIHNKGREIRIAVCSTDRVLIEWIHRVTGEGTISCYVPKSESRRVPSWHWLCFSRKASAIIEKVYPFLIVKKHQAEIILRFKKYLTNRSNPEAKLSATDAAFGKKCSDKIKMLNNGRRDQQIDPLAQAKGRWPDRFKTDLVEIAANKNTAARASL